MKKVILSSYSLLRRIRFATEVNRVLSALFQEYFSFVTFSSYRDETEVSLQFN